jgi:transmembrane sensor
MVVLPRWKMEPASGSFHTAHGQQRELPLEDGTLVHLNTDSAVQVAFSDEERGVELSRGEAFFEVTKDRRGRPFVVRTGDTEVRVVGTKFSVRTSEGRTDVVVSEGRVQVIPNATHVLPSVPARVELVPGDALRFDRADNHMQIAAIDPRRATAWLTGSIDFDNAALEDVIVEVNRYTRTPFVIADDRLRSLRLSGSFKVGDAGSVRFALKDAFGIEAESRTDRIELHGR